MNRACALVGFLAWASVLCACSPTSIEILPHAQADANTADASFASDGPAKSFCPTTIDVYGGINMALMGCGGTSQGPSPLEGGLGTPRMGDAGSEFTNTMAGRLQLRLADDPDLVPTFGQSWLVRSCAAPIETLPALVAPLADDACGYDAPQQMGALSTICSAQPAPLVLFSAGALDDRCHGGGIDSSEPDDPATFAKHFAARLDSFLIARQPKAAIVGPQTEWFGLPGQPGPGDQGGQSGHPPPIGTTDHSACQWQRPDWAETGISAWQASHSAVTDVLVVPDLHSTFKQHSACCQSFGVTCDTLWTSTDGLTPAAVNCEGADALVDFWYTQLKTFLLSNRFACPG
jgi:hypothetical protein